MNTFENSKDTFIHPAAESLCTMSSWHSMKLPDFFSTSLEEEEEDEARLGFCMETRKSIEDLLLKSKTLDVTRENMFTQIMD